MTNLEARSLLIKYIPSSRKDMIETIHATEKATKEKYGNPYLIPSDMLEIMGKSPDEFKETMNYPQSLEGQAQYARRVAVMLSCFLRDKKINVNMGDLDSLHAFDWSLFNSVLDFTNPRVTVSAKVRKENFKVF